MSDRRAEAVESESGKGHASGSPPPQRVHDLLFLGRGGMGEVHLTVDTLADGTRRLFVRKRLRPSLADDASVRRMFLEEARLAMRLHHPNIVRAFGYGREGERPYLSMELLEGESLHAILRRHHELGRRFPLAMHLRVLVDALAGLHHAHELRGDDGALIGVVHRDATPSNLFVTYAGDVKVVDFGIAKVAGSHTTTGIIKGKIAYVAPEQVAGRAIDRRADVFTIGALLFEAVTQRRLWGKQSDSEILALLDHGEVPKLSTQGDADVDPELAAIVDRALAPKRDDRYPTAEALKNALENWIATRGTKVTTAEIGATISELFADTRAKMKSAIEVGLRRLDESPERRSSRKMKASGTGDLPIVNGGSGEVTRVSGAMSTERRVQTERQILIVTALATLTVVGVFFAVLALRESTRRHDPTAVPIPGGVASHADPVVLATLAVQVTPATARAFVDDVELPIDARGKALRALPRDGVAHRVLLESPGFVASSRWVVADRDALSLQVVLDPVTSPSASPSASVTAASVAPKTSTTTVPPVLPTPTPTPPTVDSSDPWKR